MEADKRIEELEKKVAALEVRVQEQPDKESEREQLSVWFELLKYLNANGYYKNLSSSHQHQVQIDIRKKIKNTSDIGCIYNLKPEHLEAIKQMADEAMNE